MATQIPGDSSNWASLTSLVPLPVVPLLVPKGWSDVPAYP